MSAESKRAGTRGRGRRLGGRSAKSLARTQDAPIRMPYIRRQIDSFEILNEEGLSLIEQNADTILKEVGMEFLDDPEILDIFRQAGADIQGTRVRFEPKAAS